MSALPADGTVRFGVHSGPQNTDLPTYERLWTAADDLGLDWASVFDHFMPIHSDPSGPCFEGLTLLAALAAKTRRIRCGILVVGNTYRHPAVVANVAATIDHVSGGRLELGLGAGWFQHEHDRYGIPFPRLGERLARLREAAAIVKGLLRDEETTFAGRYYTLTAARCEPKPLQRPNPPLWIGGTGERVLLRIVAESADGWNMFAIPEEGYRRKLDALVGHCADVGRDPAEIRKSLVFRVVLGATEQEARDQLRARAEALGVGLDELVGQGFEGLTPERCAERFLAYRRLGVGDFLLMARPPADERSFELLAREVAPAVRAAA